MHYRTKQFRTVQRPAELEAKLKRDVLKQNSSAAVSCSDNLSQDSNTPKVNNDQLMFGCLLDKEDDDDLDIKFDTNHLDDINDILCSSPDLVGLEKKCFNFDDSFTSSLMSDDDIDVFGGESVSTGDDVCEYPEDQTILTPAYFDPGTGTVTLLLPSLNPEF